MSSEWTLFVEGGDDRAFLDSLLDHLCIYNVRTEKMGGGVSKLPLIKPNISRARDRGNQIAVVLDADRDAAARRNSLFDVIRRNDLPVERCFLLPDNKNDGCLETLLEQIALSDHRYIYDCFDAYENCIDRSEHPYSLPNKKARIYAYCEALNIETNGSRRRYDDPSHWNLEVPDLDPLKRFLLGLQSVRT